MKKWTVVFCCLLLPLALVAQERTGNVIGTVVDKDGVAIPGVTVTLTGPTIAPLTTVTNTEGKFRFLSLSPSKEFALKAEIQGFKAKTETGIIVNIGLNSDITIKMEQGDINEQVTVVATTPMVQPKKLSATTTVNYEQLQSLPTARDPWVILQLTPGLYIDRENIGGNESGQQSSFVNKGSVTQEWTLDGVKVTDMSSGGSPGYYDFDAFEEMNVSTGSLDVETRAPGTVINIVTRRGGNKTSLAGRFYLTDGQFQGKISNEKIAEIGVTGYNRIREVRDFGFNIGGPILKDKIWWWGSYAVSDVKTIVATGTNDDSYLQNLDIKANFQLIPENRAEVYVQAGGKSKFGRSSSLNYPSGWNQYGKYHFGSPIIKFQDEHMFGDNLFVSLRYGFTDAGFGMWPANDEKMTKNTWYDIERALNTGGPAGGTGGQTWWFSGRPHVNAVAQVQYFADNFLGTGTSHEMKLGFEIDNNSATSVSYLYGGKYRPSYNYNTPTLDWNKDGKNDIVRDLLIAQYGANAPTYATFQINRGSFETTTGTDRTSVYFSDLINVGRFNFQVGVRADRNHTYREENTAEALLEENRDWGTENRKATYANMWNLQNQLIDLETAKKINGFLPDKTLGKQTPQKHWLVFSPTAGLTFDVFGDGKTIAKASYRLFPGAGWNWGTWSPTGQGGQVNFHWIDWDKNLQANWTELYWRRAGSVQTWYPAFTTDGQFDFSRIDADKGTNWAGFEWTNPLGFTQNYGVYDWDNLKVGLTHDFSATLERELSRDMSISGTFSYRRYGRFSQALPYYPVGSFPTLSDPNHIRQQSDYEIVGKVPTILVNPATGQTYDPKDAANRDVWAGKNVDYVTTPTSWTYNNMSDPTSCNKYWGWDFSFNKRLSNKWMFNASFSWQTQRTYWGDNFIGNETNRWAFDGQMWATALGGNSGKPAGGTFFSRWMLKLMGMYQLPWDTSASFTLSGHEGGWVGETFDYFNYTVPNQTNGFNWGIPTTGYDNRIRLDDIWTLNLKIEKMLKIGDVGRIYFAADMFNALNQYPVLRRIDNNYGSFRYQKDGSWTYTVPIATNFKATEIMNPFVFRFGVRFQL